MNFRWLYLLLIIGPGQMLRASLSKGESLGDSLITYFMILLLFSLPIIFLAEGGLYLFRKYGSRNNGGPLRPSTATEAPANSLALTATKNDGGNAAAIANAVPAQPSYPDLISPNNRGAHILTTTSYDSENERIYAAVAEELESGNFDKGLWTRMFAEAEGDENRTKALYIKRRAERLIAAEESARLKSAEEQDLRDKNEKSLIRGIADYWNISEKEAAAVVQYGIKLEGGKFLYKNNKFDKLSDAIKKAEIQ